MKLLHCGNKRLNLSRPVVMGILNITPDSFSDGGKLFSGTSPNMEKILRTAENMISEGADILDVGGESTRPGAAQVSEQEELDRVLPVVDALVERFDILVSVDTSKAAVIRGANACGAHMINDVRALQEDGALQAAADSGLPVCLMHMQNQPDSMQRNPSYNNVVDEVLEFLLKRRVSCIGTGIKEEQILFDPGFGFGKTLAHNLALFKALTRFVESGPVLVGVSRKTMIGQMLDLDTDDRLVGSVTMALLAAQSGASILRVHDVRETVQALTVWENVKVKRTAD